MTVISAPSDIDMMATNASASRRANPSRGFTLVELLIYIVLLSIVTGGIWQSYTLINNSINETRNRALVSEDLENFNRLVSQAASRATKYTVEGRQDCATFQVQDPNGNVKLIHYKIATDTDDIAKNAKMADGWMSTSDSARCTDDVTDGNGWKKITDQGQIDVSKPNRALQIDNETEAGFRLFRAFQAAVSVLWISGSKSMTMLTTAPLLVGATTQPQAASS